MWRVAQIFNRLPWDEEIIKLNNAQLDFVIEMYAKDNKIKLTDHSIASGNHTNQVFFEWSSRLCGNARYEFDRSPRAYLLKYYKRMFD